MTVPSPPDDRNRRVRWPIWAFRVTSTVAAVMLFDQAVFAGQFLDGAFGSLHTHRENATYAGIAVLVSFAVAFTLKWPGRGPIWPALASLGVFGLIGAQIALGFARAISAHVPLGVAIILLSGLLCVWSWRR